jgi:hypothetical protein
MHGNTLPTRAGQVTSTLAEHVAEIRRLYKRVTSDIIEIGRRLTDCQGIVGHGHWHDWLKAEFGWSDSSALNFMRVYDMSKSANFTDLGIPFSALYLLAAPYTPEKTRTEIIERAKAGESVSVADVKDAIADAKGRKQPARKKAAAKPAVASDADQVERDRKACVALYQKVKDADREKAQWLADHPHAAAGLGPTIARDWDEAERAFETLTAHTVAQVAQVISPSKAALVVEIADYFTALAAKLAPHPAGNGEAPIAGDDLLIPADLSVPGFLKRTPMGATS